MRHGNKINHLGRTFAHRKALLMNLGTSLIVHKRIRTTVAKAKELRMFIEPLINKSKEDTTHNRRVVFSELRSKEAITELFNNISAKIANRNGGYTRILKLADNRPGDNTEMCYIELVDYNENMLKDPKTAAKKRTRRGKTTTVKQAVKPETKAEETTTEEVKKTEEPAGDENAPEQQEA